MGLSVWKRLSCAAVLTAGCAGQLDLADETAELHTPIVEQGRHDASPPLLLMAPAAQTERVEHEVKKLPRRPRAKTSAPAQTAASQLLMPSPLLNFDGGGESFSGPNGTFTDQYAPPDTNA